MNAMSYMELLPSKFRKGAVRMVFIGISRRLLDLIGLASLLPIIILIINPSAVEGNALMTKLFHFFGLESLAGFGLLFGIFALVMLPLKSVWTIWLAKIQNAYLLSIYRYYSRQLYSYYHDRGLLFIRQTFSSQLAFHINGACYGYAMNIVGTILNAVSDIAITLLLTGIVVWFAPMASLMLFAAMVPVLLVYFTIVKSKLKKIGFDAYEARRRQAQIVQESLRGHVSLSIYNSFNTLSKEFDQGLNTISHADIKGSVYSQIPSVILQMCVAIALIILLVAGNTNGTPVTLFILFGFTAARVMPAILSLANSWSTLQNNQYIIDIIKEAALFEKRPRPAEEKEEEIQPMIFNHQVELRNVTFAFEMNKPVFTNFSLQLRKGESVGFRGVSGAGKSTLFNLLLGFYTPLHGGIYVDGERLTTQNIKSWHKIAGYSEQDVFISNDSVARNIAMSVSEPDMGKIMKVVEQVGLMEWVSSLKEGIHTMMGESGMTVSGGEKQRIGIARALYKEPQVLFFDESTSALDTKNEDGIISMLNSLACNNLTLFIISHRESALRYCNRIIDI